MQQNLIKQISSKKQISKYSKYNIYQIFIHAKILDYLEAPLLALPLLVLYPLSEICFFINFFTSL